MNEITKLEVFAAYLPYNVEVTDELSGTDFWWYLTVVNVSHNRDGERLHLRPLSALQTPMQHPVTGERIESPAEWIAGKLGGEQTEIVYEFDMVGIIKGIPAYLANNAYCSAKLSRATDRLALELHFDVFGAIEKGWAVQI